MSTCRGVVFTGDGKYELREFAVPEPGPGGAVLKVEAVGMCGSDVAQLAGHRHVTGEVTPVVPGHEIVGRVARLASDADLGVKEGDRVAVDLVVRGRTDPGDPRGITHIYGYTLGVEHEHGLWGGYGEYMGILPGTQLLKLRDDCPAEELTLFEPLASALHWTERVDVQEGDTVVVQGPGHVGLICAAMASLRGAGRVIVTGKGNDGLRLEAALGIGAAEVIDVDATDPIERVRELSGGRMADVVMDLTDGATGPVQLSLEMARFGGRVLLAGLKSQRPAEIISDLIVTKSLTVCGGAGSTAETMRGAAELLNDRSFPSAKLVGEVRPLDGLDEAMGLLTRSLPGRDAVRVGLRHA